MKTSKTVFITGGAAGATSRHEYAQTPCAEAKTPGLPIRIPEIRRSASAGFLRPAPRPANSRLDCARRLRTAGIALPD